MGVVIFLKAEFRRLKMQRRGSIKQNANGLLGKERAPVREAAVGGILGGIADSRSQGRPEWEGCVVAAKTNVGKKHSVDGNKL